MTRTEQRDGRVTRSVNSTQRVLAAIAAVTVIPLSLIGFGPGFSTERVAEGTPQANAQEVKDYRAEQLRIAIERADEVLRADEQKDDNPLNLPVELVKFRTLTLSEAADTDTRTLMLRTAIRSNDMWEKLGMKFDTPIMMSRDKVTECLRRVEIIAAACANRVEYREDYITDHRNRFGDLTAVIIGAHEVGHHMVYASGNDGPSVPEARSEARASCASGAFVATMTDVTPDAAGVAYLQTPLRFNGPEDFEAFKSGFNLTRAGVNPFNHCSTYPDP